jgi:general secretion pathway protein E
MPTQHGERCNTPAASRRGLLDLSKIGLFGRDEATVRRLLALPHGLI